MKVITYQEPYILLEAVELVYACVNQLPTEHLAPVRELGFPIEEVLRIRSAVCQSLDLEDPELQFFFRGVPFGGESGELSCIARCLVYNTLELDRTDPDDMAKALINSWHEMQGPIAVSGMDQYSISFVPNTSGEFLPLSREIAKLAVPTSYQLQLLDAFSHFEVYVNRLVCLLRPTMEKLSELLKPWILLAQPTLNKWEEFLSEENVVEYFFSAYHMKVNVPEVLEIALRYFPPRGGMVHVSDSGSIARLLMGVSMEVGWDRQKKKEALSDHEFTALRLIANPDRVAMLQAMMIAPMSGQELIQKLGLNSGSVFRDLNSMCNANLVTREFSKSKSTHYRTNYPLLQSLFHRTLRIIAPDEET